MYTRLNFVLSNRPISISCDMRGIPERSVSFVDALRTVFRQLEVDFVRKWNNRDSKRSYSSLKIYQILYDATLRVFPNTESDGK